MGEDFRELFGDWDPASGKPPFGDDLPPGEPENRSRRDLHEKPAKVVGVFQHTDADSGDDPRIFVLLQDEEERRVPIWIGRFEAFAISAALEGTTMDRPFTHDLIRIVIERMGAEVTSVIVDDLWNETFYAKLTLVLGPRSHEIDCRPSDAIAIALRTNAPIFVAEAVFESVSHST